MDGIGDILSELSQAIKLSKLDTIKEVLDKHPQCVAKIYAQKQIHLNDDEFSGGEPMQSASCSEMQNVGTETAPKLTIDHPDAKLPLHYAVVLGNAKAFEVMVSALDDNTYLDLKSQWLGYTVLHVACQTGQLEVVMSILEKGGSIDIQDKHGRSPLYVACSSGQIEAVKCLTKHKAKLNLAATSGAENGRSPLHVACISGHPEIVRHLIDVGADINSQDSKGQTPLHVSATNGMPACAKVLVIHRADVGKKDQKDCIPLHCCFSLSLSPTEDQLDIVKMLVKCSQLNSQNSDGVAMVHYAAYWNLASLLEDCTKYNYDTNPQDVKGRSALHYCFLPEKPSVDAARALINYGCNIQLRDKHKKTALHELVKYDSNSNEEVGHLIQEWANIKGGEEFGKSVLHLAVVSGNIDLVRSLLNANVDVDLQDDNGNTSLHLATIANKSGIVKVLLSQGASVNLQNHQEQAPLHLAATLKSCTIAEMLLQAGASVVMKDVNGLSCLHKASGWGVVGIVKCFVQIGAMVNEFDFKGQRPIHYGAEEGKVDIVEFLIKSGSKVSIQDKDGKTPLHLAAKGGHNELVKLLISHGGELNLVDKNGQSPLHVASFFGKISVVKTLVDLDSDVRLTDSQGQTPFDIALEMGYEEASEILKNHYKQLTSTLEKNSKLRLSQTATSSKTKVQNAKAPQQENDTKANHDKKDKEKNGSHANHQNQKEAANVSTNRRQTKMCCQIL